MKKIICAILSIVLFSVSVCAETQDVVNSQEKEMYDGDLIIFGFL